MHPTNYKKIFLGIVFVAILLFALLSIPASDPPVANGVAGKPFTWRQDTTWNALEASFRQARSLGCDGLKELIDGSLRQGGRYLATLAASQFGPDATIFTKLEENIFSLGTMVAACPEMQKNYIDL